MLVLTVFVMIYSSGTAEESNLSPFALKLSRELSEKATDLNYKPDNYDISGMIKFNSDFNFDEAKALGAYFPTLAGNIATVRIPLISYLSFTKLKGIDYIEIQQLSAPTLDSARSVTGADNVINGLDLPKQYKGEGVVIGVIDAGFDYTHPAFYDSESKTLKIKRVWEQSGTANPPENFKYGRELKTPEEIISAGKDIENFSHGTHVAGITVGDKVPEADQYYGIAPKAELVIVALKPPSQEQWKNTGGSDIIDGINYIFQYAKSVNKPAVVNLSWGGQIGPHDGTSLFSQAVDALTGAGKIFVTSAGNNGSSYLHINKTFNLDNQIMLAYLKSTYNANDAKNGVWFDTWGEKDKPYTLQLSVIDPSTDTAFFESNIISCAKDTSANYIYKVGNDSCVMGIYSKKSSFNGKPNIFVDVENSKPFVYKVYINASEGTVNMWNWYLVDYYGITRNFTTEYSSYATKGDKNTTISDFASTKSSIAVGALVSKRTFTNLNGTFSSLTGSEKDIAFFSSLGPSTDNRVKPDICAPGMCLISAVNSFDNNYAPKGSNYRDVTNKVNYNGKDYYYAQMSGTSMSSPVVSGAVALMLSIKPDLTPAQVQELLKRNAKKDKYTGELPNMTWGYGKLNIYNAIKDMLGILTVDEALKYDDIKVYPNPVTDIINIDNPNNRNISLEIVNILGETIYSKSITGSESISNLNYLSSGIYYIILKDKNQIVHKSKAVKK